MSNQHEISITERARSRVKPETRKFISKNIDIAKRIRAVLNEQNSTVENMASLLDKDVDETYLMISGMYNLTLEDITEIINIREEELDILRKKSAYTIMLQSTLVRLLILEEP